MTMEGIQRALIGKKQAYRKDELYPSKYAGTSILFDEDEDESRSLLPKCSLLDQSLAISVDAPKTPFFDVKNTIGDSTRDDDDDETSRQLDEDEEQLRERVIPVSTADTHWHDANLFDDPLRITATSPPLSMLHGIALCDDEVDMDEPAHTHYIRTPRTPKVVYKGNLFESAPLSPITLPDDYGLERGLSFVESLTYSSVNDDTHPTSLLKMRNDCSTPTMFQSSPLTSEPDDSILQQSMSSFIGNDESMLVVERGLFDSVTKSKKPPVKLYDENKSDLRETIQLPTTARFMGSLPRARPLLKFEEDDDDLENLSRLGLDTVYHESKLQHQSPIKNDSPLLMKASSSPTGVTEFHQDEDFTFSLPPPPATSPKIDLISRLVDQVFGGCQPLGGMACGGIHVQCSSEEYTKKQQQQPAAAVEKSWNKEFPTPASSSMKRPELVKRGYSPGEELALARQNANISHNMSCRKNLRLRVVNFPS